MARRSSPLFRAAILLTASTMTLTPFAADAQLTPMGRADSNRPLLGKLQPPLVSAQASAGTPPPGYPPAKCQSPPPPASPPHGQSRNALPNSPFPATWQAVLDSYVAEGKIPGGVIIVKSPDWGVRVGVAMEDCGSCELLVACAALTGCAMAVLRGVWIAGSARSAT